MKSRASLIIVSLVLLVCFVCPLTELFDQWDHTLQTGNDIDYPVMILAICVGVAYLFERFVPKMFSQDSLSEAVFDTFAPQIFPAPSDLSSRVTNPASPPCLKLRV